MSVLVMKLNSWYRLKIQGPDPSGTWRIWLYGNHTVIHLANGQSRGEVVGAALDLISLMDVGLNRPYDEWVEEV